MGLDYDYEIGNGWNEYQKLILHEMRRMADQGEDNANKLHAVDLRLVGIEQRHLDWIDLSRVRGEKLDQMQDEIDQLKRGQSSHRALLHGTKKTLTVAFGILAWVVATGISAYGVVFH